MSTTTDKASLPAEIERTPRRLRRLLETTKAVPWEADAKTWRFTYVGPQAENLLGLPVERWYESDFWSQHLHPEDRDMAIDFCATEMQKRAEYEFEYRMIAADDRIVWIHDLVSVVYRNREPVGLRGFLIDITERKKAEERLRSRENQLRLITDSLPAFVSYTDLDGRYRFNNAAYERWFGVSREELFGQRVEDVIGRKAYEGTRAYAEAAYRGQASTFETVVPKGDEGPRRMRFDFMPDIDDQGVVQGYFLLANDVTDEKKAEEELRRHQAEMARVGRIATLGELSAALAHELNQPLMAILANAQAAQQLFKRPDPDRRQLDGALEDIAIGARRAGELIRRLRELMEKSDVRRQSVLVNDAVRRVEVIVRADARFEDALLELELADDLPEVLAHPIQVEQVLLNLTRNGLEAMAGLHRAERQLVIATSARGESELEIAVRDCGPPVEDEVLEQMFEPFYTTKNDGVGMGLAISRTIIEAHGGRVEAVRNRDRGMTVSMSLPVGEEGAE